MVRFCTDPLLPPFALFSFSCMVAWYSLPLFFLRCLCLFLSVSLSLCLHLRLSSSLLSTHDALSALSVALCSLTYLFINLLTYHPRPSALRSLCRSHSLLSLSSSVSMCLLPLGVYLPLSLTLCLLSVCLPGSVWLSVCLCLCLCLCIWLSDDRNCARNKVTNDFMTNHG